MTAPAPPPSGSAELAVIGAGPAGMAAALAAADAGCEVVVVDSAPAAGGQVYRQSQLGGGTGMSERVPRRFHRLAGHPRIRLLGRTTVWQAEAHPRGGARLWLTREGACAGVDGGATPVPPVLDAGAVVLATGATELVLPFPGWDLPGVLTAGAAQSLVKAQGVRPGDRVLVAGTGPFLLPVAAELARAGARVQVAEAARPHRRPALISRLAAHPAKLREAAGYAATLARYRVPIWFGQAVAACEGDGRVERAYFAPVGGGRFRRPVDVDAVCVTSGFVPSLELARALGCADRQHADLPQATVIHDADQATTVAGIFAAGEVTGIGGADVAALEGRLAGTSAAAWLGHHTHPLPRGLRVGLLRARRFAALLEELYPLDPGWVERLRADTLVCRCEEVAWSRIRRAVEAGAGDVRALKGVSRCGMGYCQGRICGPVAQLAVSTLTGRSLAQAGDLHRRPIATPVPLAEVAASPSFEAEAAGG